MPLLLCDLDDTLANRQALFEAWALSFLAEAGRDPGELSWLLELDDHGFTPRDAFFAQVIERFVLEESLHDLSERYHRDYILSFRCARDVVTALDRARRAGYKIAIVTNGATRAQTAKVTAAGLDDLVDACCVSEAEGYWKPAPELFRRAAELCEEPLDGAWMVGDNPVTDIGGAWALGLRTAWIHQARQWPEHLDYRPTIEAESVSDAIHRIVG